MSINSALDAGASGLQAQSAALSAISNNIANSQTVGYKTDDVAFETLVSGPGASAALSGGGVIAVGTQSVTTQGLLQTASSATDLGISGEGFFITTNSPTAPTTTTPVLYTRAGAFTTNSQGFLVNSAGLYLQGWPLNSAGVVQSDPTNVTKLQPINVSAIAGAATPTTSVQINANINSGQTTQAAAATYNASVAATSMAGGGVTPDVTIPIPLSDSTGGQQTFQIDLLQSGTPNVWDAEIVANPADSVTVAAGVPAGQVAAGTIAFTSSGQYDPVNSTGIFASNAPTITIGASNAAAPAAGQVNWASSLGVASQTVAFTLGGTAGGLTQFDSPSAVQSISANGTVFGNLTGVQVGSDGSVTAVFDNGVTREVSQIALATVPNPDGLTAASGDAYTISNSSGSATLKTPGEGGAGSLSPSTLEASTVDLSTEFTNLITTQNAYSASAKIITTADQMLQALLAVIQ
jgi:flagellar hook protein FlgE